MSNNASEQKYEYSVTIFGVLHWRKFNDVEDGSDLERSSSVQLTPKKVDRNQENFEHYGVSK